MPTLVFCGWFPSYRSQSFSLLNQVNFVKETVKRYWINGTIACILYATISVLLYDCWPPGDALTVLRLTLDFCYFTFQVIEAASSAIAVPVDAKVPMRRNRVQDWSSLRCSGSWGALLPFWVLFLENLTLVADSKLFVDDSLFVPLSRQTTLITSLWKEWTVRYQNVSESVILQLAF